MAAAPATATFPGGNGRIAFQDYKSIGTIDAGGGDRRRLTSDEPYAAPHPTTSRRRGRPTEWTRLLEQPRRQRRDLRDERRPERRVPSHLHLRRRLLPFLVTRWRTARLRDHSRRAQR